MIIELEVPDAQMDAWKKRWKDIGLTNWDEYRAHIRFSTDMSLGQIEVVQLNTKEGFDVKKIVQLYLLK